MEAALASLRAWNPANPGPTRPVPERVVVVTGLPGAGKTALARSLAASLCLPLIAKDTIKEALGEALGPVDGARSRELGAASYEVLFAVAAEVPGAVIIEGNFGERSAPAILALATAPPVQVFCDCPVDVAVERYNDRPRHRVHHTPLVTRERLLDMGPTSPLPLGGELLRVDTSAPVQIATLAERITAVLA
jgi:predicted kinase